MASGGKKKSKTKGKTVALHEFLQKEDGTVPSHLPTGSSSWAAEMDNVDNEDIDERRQAFDRSKLPTAPKAARGPDVNPKAIPDRPPFTLFVGNLPYDASEDKIKQFFEGRNLEVVNVRLPNDNGRLRGFGYVEFAKKQDILDAFLCNDEPFNGRRLRIDVCGASDQRGDNSSRSDRNDWRGGGDPDRTEGDWRKRDPPTFGRNDRDRGNYDDRGYNSRGGGRYGDQDDRYGGDRYGGGFSSRGGDRDGRGFGDRYSDGGDKGGGRFSDRDYDRSGGRYSDRGRDNGYEERDSDRFQDRRYGGFEDRRGGGRYDDRRSGGDRYGGRSSFDDRGFGGRRDGGYRRDDEGGRYSGQRDERSSREGSQEGPRERPRLNLQPRTKPVEPGPSEPSRQSSIFGSAKPVDTAAKEREIEEKMKKLEVNAHYTSDDAAQRESGYREGAQSRRDSDGGRGGGRERRLSSSSGKTGTSRRDSETSRTSDDSHPGDRDTKPPAKEEHKMVPAPPPKENAWAKPRSEAVSQSSEPSRQASGGSRRQDQERDHDYSRQDNRHPSDEGRQSSRGHNADQDESRGERPEQSHKRKEKALPKSIDDMPKLDEGPAK